MLKKINSNSKAFTIVYGAIGSIVASAILHLAPIIADWLAGSSWGVIVNFINHRYEAAATLEPMNYSFFILMALFVVITMLWFEIAGRLKKKLFGTSERSVPIEVIDGPSRTAKVVLYSFIQFVIPLYLLYILVQISAQVVTLNAITDFRQHMRIVAPYITEEESKQLFSKWSQMRTVEDYDAIYKRLSQVAESNKVRLPKNHLY